MGTTGDPTTPGLIWLVLGAAVARRRTIPHPKLPGLPGGSMLREGNRICVTGANGFVASHLINRLIEAGYSVRGTVRDPSNRAKVAHLDDLEVELVSADLMVPSSFDEAFEECAAVVHCAAAVAFTASDPQRELVDPSVQGTLNVLESAHKAGVGRVVHTSSMSAIYGWSKAADHVFTEADWNTDSTLQTDPYGLAKVEAERAALRYVAEHPGCFELVHLHPGMVWGPPLCKAHAKASPRLVRDIVSRAQPGLPQLMLSVVDVRDVAAAHLAALVVEAPPSRCLVFAENAWMPDLAKRMQALFPQISMTTRRVPKPFVLAFSLFDPTLNTAQLRRLINLSLTMDNGLGRSAYGLDYRPVEVTLRDTIDPLLREGWAKT